MPDNTVRTVCLPSGTPGDQIVAVASARLAEHGIVDADPVDHFRTRTRLYRSHLVHSSGRTAAGGPVRLLNLARMRTELSQRYANRWQLWHQIVAGSPVARSWWQFHDRHLADPRSYTWAQARYGFASQPRIARMISYNSHPGRKCELALHHLDAFEAGAQAYMIYGWLQAVPADSLLTLDGRQLRAASARHVDELDYLRLANEHLDELTGTDVLVAVGTW